MELRNYTFRLILLALAILFSHGVAQNERRVAIVPFSNDGTSQYDWVGRGIEEIIYDKLTNLSAIKVFEKETFDRILRKNGVRRPADLSIRKAFQLGQETEVDVLISGSYLVNGDNLSLKFRALSTYTGATIFEKILRGSLGEIYSLHEKAILQLMAAMAVPLSASEKSRLARSSTTSILAFEYYCKAYTEFRKGSSIEVVASLFTRALEKDPDFWEAQYNLGVIYYNFDKYALAIEQFNKVILKNASFYKPYYGLGVIYYLQRRFHKAKENFSKVLSLHPNHDRSMYYLGRVFIRQDSVKKGLEFLQKSAELNPNYAPTHYQIAIANMRRGWYKTAIQAFKKSLKLDPENYRAHNTMGECYYLLQRFDEAIYHYRKCIELRPDYSTAYFNLGNTVYKRGALQEIVGAYLEILETRYTQNSDDQNNDIVNDLRRLREKGGAKSQEVYDTMIRNYKLALKYEPRFFEASFNLALTYENIGYIDSSVTYYEMSLSNNPQLVRAHMRVGRIFERQKRYDKALAHFKEVVKVEPSYFAATPRLGEEYRYINIIEEVLKEFQIKQELNPKDRDTLLVLARIFNSLGRYGQAREYYQQIVHLDPRNSEANRALKNLRRRMREL